MSSRGRLPIVSFKSLCLSWIFDANKTVPLILKSGQPTCVEERNQETAVNNEVGQGSEEDLFLEQDECFLVGPHSTSGQIPIQEGNGEMSICKTVKDQV